jgi:hypothetical protein
MVSGPNHGGRIIQAFMNNPGQVPRYAATILAASAITALRWSTDAEDSA